MKMAMARPRRRVPVGEVEDHAGEETCLERAEQKAQHVELPGRGDPGHQGGAGAPADHDAQDGLAGADLFEEQVAGHLEQEVADEEQPGAQREHGVAQVQVGLHLQLREADVHAVDIGKHIGNQKQRQDVPVNLGKIFFSASVSTSGPFFPTCMAAMVVSVIYVCLSGLRKS